MVAERPQAKRKLRFAGIACTHVATVVRVTVLMDLLLQAQIEEFQYAAMQQGGEVRIIAHHSFSGLLRSVVGMPH